MPEVKDTIDHWVARFDADERARRGSSTDWFAPTRRTAVAHLGEWGFPATRDEQWRFTNVAPIAATPFTSADVADVRPKQVAPFQLGEGEAHTLVFVNGRHAPALSSVGSLPKGVRVAGLAAAMTEHRAIVEAHLAQYVTLENSAFTALNTAMFHDGAFVHVPRGCVLETPIHLLFVATGGDRATATHPRNLIVIESNAQASVVESYVALADGAYFTNPVTEIVAGDNAIVRHYKVERESAQAYHIAAQQLQQLRTSSVSSHNVSIGGAIVRNDVNTRLDGEGAHCTLYGLSTIHGAQHVDNHLIVDHAQPHCDSREFYKGVYDDRSRGVFSGRIIVREGAQKTDAKQTNQTLLLSRDAQVDSKPQLEIFADDVKCTHGATIGQVSEDAVFYLRSRGVSADAARNLLVYAFAREIVATIRLDSLRATLDALLFHRLPQEAGLMEVA